MHVYLLVEKIAENLLVKTVTDYFRTPTNIEFCQRILAIQMNMLNKDVLIN